MYWDYYFKLYIYTTYASNSSNVYSIYSTFVDSPQAVDKILDISTEDGDHLTQQKHLAHLSNRVVLRQLVYF